MRFQKLRERGQQFMKEANAVCKECEYLKKGRCSICGCLASYKILAGALHLSKCPKGKW